jgi:K+-transporting ATPase KdpF subunit
MTVDVVLPLVVSVALLVYLVMALLSPDRF